MTIFLVEKKSVS